MGVWFMKIINLFSRYDNKAWYIFIKELYYRVKGNEISAVGAQLTYYFILSLFPFLIFFLSLISYTTLVTEEVLADILIILPIDAQNVIRGIVNEFVSARSETLLSTSIFLYLWTSSLGIGALVKALNKSYGRKNTRPYLVRKLIAMLFTLVLAILLIIVLSMLVFGEFIGNRLLGFLGATNILYHLWEVMRMFIPLTSMIIVFCILYMAAPSSGKKDRIRLRFALPGAIFTTVGWIIASTAFSFYVKNFANYSRTYGSLGGIIILLIWLYFTNIIIVFGGEINGTYMDIYTNRNIQ